MTTLFEAIDKSTNNPTQTGENGHTEMSWSKDIEDQIVQFDFQCVRTDKNGIHALHVILKNLLFRLAPKQTNAEMEQSRKNNLTLLYKIIGKTRDLDGGKGEYALTYMMITTWHIYFPEMAKYALFLCVNAPIGYDATFHPYGSWKDVKYLCKYMYTEHGISCNHPLSQYCIELINNQLRADDEIYCAMATKKSNDNVTDTDPDTLPNNATDIKPGSTISLVSKWIAREKSKKFGWMNVELAKQYFNHYIQSAKCSKSMHKAIKKCQMEYRILCSKLNIMLDTVQIKQTSQRWAEIDHSKTTSITHTNQRKAFLNIPVKKCNNNNNNNNNGEEEDNDNVDDYGSDANFNFIYLLPPQLHNNDNTNTNTNNNVKPTPTPRSTDPDRIKCAENYIAYLEGLKKAGKEVKGKHVGLNKFTQQALQLLKPQADGTVNQTEIDILNSQWRDNTNQKNAKGLGFMAGMVDLSGSMEGDPLLAAIALGARVAERSILGKRVLTFSEEPAWIDLDNCNTFTEMVHQIYANSMTAGRSTNFYAALDLILTAIEQYHVPPEEVENMILAIFSDMQIDHNLGGGECEMTEATLAAGKQKWDTMYLVIKQKYHDVGMRLYGKPFTPPHILFWNLRYTGGFPVLTSQGNTSMMSGFDPTILNMFCEMGMDALRNLTPLSTLIRLLDNERYIPLDVAICAFLEKQQI